MRQAFDPPGDARPDWRIISDLARRLGASSGWDYASPADILAEVAALTPIYGGITFDRLDATACSGRAPTPRTRHADPAYGGVPARAWAVQPGALSQPRRNCPTTNTPDPDDRARAPALAHAHDDGRVGGLEFLAPEERVEVHTQDAARLGIADGDWIRITSRRGSVTARARVFNQPRQGVVFMTFHYAEALGK